MVEFGEAGNLLGVLMKCTNYCDDGFIAGISNFTILEIAFRNIKLKEFGDCARKSKNLDN